MKRIVSIFLILFISSLSVYAFNDMNGFEWANDAVNELSQNGILNGVEENIFAPQENVTYEQLAKMVATAFNLSAQSDEMPADVPASRWSAPFIQSTKKFYAEKADGNFTPEAFMPRFEVAAVITRAAFEAKGIEPSKERQSSFFDVDMMSSWIMQDWIAAAKQNGIVKGYEDNTFRPRENVTRAETAVMLQRALNIDKKGVNEMSEITKVAIEMEDGGKMVLELYPQFAPKTVENFVSLVNDGFYDGLTFHRVISGFMIQGGDPNGTGMGGSGKNITGEFASNGFKENTLKHTRGVISMARSMSPNSASSQFFIMHQDSPHLDGQYAAFGKVVEGIETIDKIASVQTDASDKPITPVVIKKMQIIE